MTILTGTIMLALLATVIALGMGVISMAHGGKFDREHSEQFMFARVGLQGVAFILLLIAMLVTYLS